MAAVATVAALVAMTNPHAAATTQARASKVVLVIATDPVAENLEPAVEESKDPRDGLLRHYSSLGLGAALMSTTQGEYTQRQSLLDISQGTRQPQAIYGSSLGDTSLVETSTGWQIQGWDDVRQRAKGASATIRPGLLASTTGGAAFIASDGAPRAAALVAADESGQVAEVSTGSQATIVDRYRAAADGAHRLIVVAQPPGPGGKGVLAELVRARRATELIIAVHLPPTPAERPPVPNPASRFFLQSAVAIGGGQVGGESLRSASTRRPGLVAAIDLAPTALAHLELAEPRSMRGHVVADSEMSVDQLEDARRRWSLVRAGRQGQALRTTALFSLAIFLGVGLFQDLGKAARLAARTLGLAFMAFPAAALAVAKLGPATSSSEAMGIAVGSMAVGLVADRLVRWPAAPLVPAFCSLLAVTVDLMFGGHALAASVVGPSVASGNRFYGISNELEPILPALLLAGLAAASSFRRQGRTSRASTVIVFSVSGLGLAAVVASGRLGADVGGVITIAGGLTVAAVLAAGVRPTVRLVGGALLLSGLGGLLLLMAADRILGADSHLANNLERLQSPAEFFELVSRRYELAAHVAAQPSQLLMLGAALVSCAFVYRNREALLGELPSPFWRAALVGTLAGGVCGALSNDSGPVLFVNAAVAAAAIALYIGGGRRRSLDATHASAMISQGVSE